MKENIEYLQKLGLNEYQSRALVVVFSKRELTAKEVSELAGIPYTRIYEVLDFLEYREFVKSTSGKPKLYKAESPKKVMACMLKREQKRIDLLKHEVEKQINLLGKIELVPEIKEEVHPVLAVSPYASI